MQSVVVMPIIDMVMDYKNAIKIGVYETNTRIAERPSCVGWANADCSPCQRHSKQHDISSW
jgi:hypothetical protein